MQVLFLILVIIISEFLTYKCTKEYERNDFMEKSAKRKGSSKTAKVVLTPIITGLATFAICVLLFPLLLLKTDDAVLYVPVASCAAVALSAFFASLSLSKVANLHFAASGFITALTISIVLLLSGLAFGNSGDVGFTAINCIMSLVFSLLGAKLGKSGGTKKRKRR